MVSTAACIERFKETGNIFACSRTIKEISVRSLADCTDNEGEMSLTTHKKEYRVCNNGLEKSLNKQMTVAVSKQKPAIPEERENLISRVTTLSYSNVQFSTKNYQIIAWLIHREKKEKNLIETMPEEAQTLELLIKDVKSTVLYMHNMLQEVWEKNKGKQEKDIQTNNECQ